MIWNWQQEDWPDWLYYFAQIVLEAQSNTQHMVDFVIEKTKLYDRTKDKLNERQAKAVDRMFKEGLNGFTGGLPYNLPRRILLPCH